MECSSFSFSFSSSIIRLLPAIELSQYVGETANGRGDVAWLTGCIVYPGMCDIFC